jgi:two-component system, cell cycle response regulator
MNHSDKSYQFFTKIDTTQKKILIIDDDTEYRLSMMRLLGSYGFHLLEASNGQEGSEIATSEKPDIILVDIVMPGMRGIDLIRQLRLQMGTLLIPVIVITGLHDVQTRIEAYQAGADSVLVKPVEPDELLALLERSIEMWDRFSSLTYIDALTEIYNRRFFDASLSAELNRSLRHQQIFSLVMMDIDFFKHFNDQYGHHAGDFVLRSVAQFIKQSVRKQDIVSRFGGEEFTAIMPLTAKADSAKVMDRIRQKLSQTSFDMDHGKQAFQIQISIGIAEFPGDAQNETDLVNASDQALYQAKNTGRNQVVIYQPIPIISHS